MKKPILLLAFLAAFAGGLILPALADNNTVDVSVTPMVVAVNVDPTSIDYGSLALSAADDAPNDCRQQSNRRNEHRQRCR